MPTEISKTGTESMTHSPARIPVPDGPTVSPKLPAAREAGLSVYLPAAAPTIWDALTLVTARAALVEAGGWAYAIPTDGGVEVLRLEPDSFQAARRTDGGRAGITLRGRTVPLVDLTDLFCGSRPRVPDRTWEDALVVVIGTGSWRAGLCVDSLNGEQDIVIHPLGSPLRDIPGLAGATIQGDGRITLVVDTAKAVTRICAARPNFGMEHSIVPSA
jgi:two-component system chemotaxis sensor kinase CheA